jgi:hypothetical protein
LQHTMSSILPPTAHNPLRAAATAVGPPNAHIRIRVMHLTSERSLPGQGYQSQRLRRPGLSHFSEAVNKLHISSSTGRTRPKRSALLGWASISFVPEHRQRQQSMSMVGRAELRTSRAVLLIFSRIPQTEAFSTTTNGADFQLASSQNTKYRG